MSNELKPWPYTVVNKGTDPVEVKLPAYVDFPQRFIIKACDRPVNADWIGPLAPGESVEFSLLPPDYLDRR